MKKIIIGLSGKKGSGKSTLATRLMAHVNSPFGYLFPGLFPLAGPIKKFCIDVLGLLPEQVYGTNARKNSPTRYRWMDLPHYHRLSNALIFEDHGQLTSRQVMQEVGKMMRFMDQDVWTKACISAIQASNYDVAIIDDVRFPNEIEHIKAHGGIVLRLTRDVLRDGDRDESETALDRENFDWNQFDGVIVNDHLDEEQTFLVVRQRLTELNLPEGSP